MTQDLTDPKLWTTALAATGLINVTAIANAEEAKAQPVLTALSATTLSGYVETTANWALGTGNDLYGRSYDGTSKQDGFNLDAVYLQLEKPLEEGGWSAGYRVQLMFGPDANALASTSTVQPASDFAIKEANVALRAPIGNGLDFRVGVWTELLGYEITESFMNPNYSRSWGFFLEPIIHTGILTSYRFNDVVSASAGVVDNGVASNAINSRSGIESVKSYTGLITLTAPESFGFMKGSTLNLSILDSGTAGRMNPINYYAGFTMPTPLKGLTVGLSDDYRANGQFDHSYENAVDLYLMYAATDKLKFASRTEYATGSAGAFGVVPAAGADNVKLLGETFTVEYPLWKNVITRGELRWDHSLTGQEIYGNADRLDAVSLTANIIYRF